MGERFSKLLGRFSKLLGRFFELALVADFKKFIRVGNLTNRLNTVRLSFGC